MKKNSKISRFIIIGIISTLTLTACQKKSGQEEPPKEVASEDLSQEVVASIEEESSEEIDHYPLKMDNFGHNTVYEEAPKKVLCLDLNAATSMVALGLEDRVFATRTSGIDINKVNEKYRDKVSKIDIPEEFNEAPLPSLEVLLNLQPEMIVMDSFYFNVEDIFGKYEDYVENGIKIYVTEGTQVDNPTIENSYNDLYNLGKIFSVEDRAEELVDQLRAEQKEITEAIKNEPVKKVMVFDSGIEMPIVAGGSGLENSLLDLAKAENVFSDLDKGYAKVSYEEIINRNPELIIVHDTPEGESAEEIIQALKSNPELAGVKAIQDDAFITVPLSYVFSGLHNIDGLRIIAEGLHPSAFSK